MKASSLRPPVSELVFHLYDRPIHPEFYAARARRHVRRPDCELSVAITPTGHALEWRSGPHCLTEITAAECLELPPEHIRLQHKMRGENSLVLDGLGDIQYHASFQVETLPLEIYLHVHDEILRDASRRGMLHNFEPQHRLAMAPLGYVTIEAWSGCLLVSSFHTFPDEHTVVKTQSLIERK